MERLKDDLDQDVIDQTENTEAFLLNQHKILKVKFTEYEQKCLTHESELTLRWNKEEEERKRRAEEEEDNKFDYTSYLLETKKPPLRKGNKPGIKGKGGISSTGVSKTGGIGNRKA